MSCAWSVNKEAGATVVDDVVEGAADFTTVGETVAAMVYWMVVFNSMLELLGMVYLDLPSCVIGTSLDKAATRRFFRGRIT